MHFHAYYSDISVATCYHVWQRGTQSFFLCKKLNIVHITIVKLYQKQLWIAAHVELICLEPVRIGYYQFFLCICCVFVSLFDYCGISIATCYHQAVLKWIARSTFFWHTTLCRKLKFVPYEQSNSTEIICYHMYFGIICFWIIFNSVLDKYI